MSAEHARVVATFGRQSLVATDDGRLFPAVRRGKRGDVVIGDRVSISSAGEGAVVIDAIEPRASVLFRADATRTKEMAANIDQVAIVFAPQPVFSESFIWRALLAASTARLDAVVLLNKADLLPASKPAQDALGLLVSLGHRIEPVSVKHAPMEAREQLLESLSGRTTLLVGQSGMGKSSVLNLLVPHALARTQEYSIKLNLGRQTTTASRWFDLSTADGGGALVDSPGFQSFGLTHLAPADAAGAMPDFAAHVASCRFLNCRHLHEPGCAIRDAVTRGTIHAERHAFYQALCTELRA